MLKQKNILFQFFLIIVLSIFEKTFNRKTLYIPGVTISTRMDSTLIELPYESPSLIPGWSNLQNIYSDKDGEILTKITNFVEYWGDIIGYLPPAIQYALIKSISDDALSGNNTAPIFDYNKFIDLMSEKVGDNDEIRIKLIWDSLFDYVKKEQERIPLGLGCLQKVAEQYGTKNKRNAELLQSVTKSISNIIEQQIDLINAEYEFIYKVGKILNNRLKYFFNFTIDKFNVLDSNTNNFIDVQHKRFKFDSGDDITSDLLNVFKKKNEFNKLLAKNSLLAQANIGQMEGCIEDKKNNENAGVSSYQGNSTLMKKRGEYVAHSKANGTRSDRKTQNGYLLNFGFGLGRELIPGQSPHKNLIPYKYYQYIEELKSLSIKMNNDTEFITPAEELSKILNDVTRYDEFEDGLIINIFKSSEDSSFIENITTFYSIFSSPYTYINSTAFFIQYSNSLYTITKYGEELESIATLSNSSNHLTSDDYSSYKGVIGIYNNNTFIVSYAVKKQDGTTVYEISLNGNKVKNNDNELISQTLNACFGVIYSGGKNDKDVCRNVFKETCGNELDYRCKESGLYDILTENPISINDYPIDCSSSSNISCYNWINKNILGGGLVIRPSVFGSFSLMLERYSQEKDVYNDDSIVLNSEGNEQNEISDALDGLWEYVEKPKADNNDLNVALKKTVFYQVNQSLYLKIKNYITTIILFFLINI